MDCTSWTARYAERARTSGDKKLHLRTDEGGSARAHARVPMEYDDPSFTKPATRRRVWFAAVAPLVSEMQQLCVTAKLKLLRLSKHAYWWGGAGQQTLVDELELRSAWHLGTRRVELDAGALATLVLPLPLCAPCGADQGDGRSRRGRGREDADRAGRRGDRLHGRARGRLPHAVRRLREPRAAGVGEPGGGDTAAHRRFAHHQQGGPPHPQARGQASSTDAARRRAQLKRALAHLTSPSPSGSHLTV